MLCLNKTAKQNSDIFFNIYIELEISTFKKNLETSFKSTKTVSTSKPDFSIDVFA